MEGREASQISEYTFNFEIHNIFLFIIKSILSKMKLNFWKMLLKQNQLKIRPLKLTEEHSKRIAWVIYFWKNRLWKKKFNFERTVFGKSTLSRFFLSHCLKFQKTLQIPTPRTRHLSDPPPLFLFKYSIARLQKMKRGWGIFSAFKFFLSLLSD